METVNLVLIGFGSVSQCLCQILLKKKAQDDEIKTGSGQTIKVVGVADSSVALYCEQGLPISELLEHKQSGNSLSTFAKKMAEGQLVKFPDSLSMVVSKEVSFHVLLDASPVDLKTGGIGLRCVKSAFQRGCHVVLANKAPLVLRYEELMKQAKEQQCHISFSATVCGGLPVVNVGKRDLIGATISSVKGILNATSNYVLTEMENGKTQQEALKAAQDNGISETDPTLDLAGYDTANKLVIIANSVLDVVPKISLDAVDLVGIEKVTSSDLKEAASRGKTIKLVASAVWDEESKTFRYKVGPLEVDRQSFLGNCKSTDKCVLFSSDIYETTFLKTDERGVEPTAAAVLRDVVHMYP